MKTLLFLLLICFAFLMQSTKPVYAQENTLKEVESKIKELEKNEQATEKMINQVNEIKGKFENGQLFMMPGMMYLFNREDFETFITLKVYNGSLAASEVVSYTKKLIEYSKEIIKGLSEALSEAERGLRKIKDDLIYFRTEKERLKNLTDCIPKVEGTYIINGDPTGILILIQTGAFVHGTYGKDMNNQINELSGNFTCNELKGTYTNHEYNISGTFVYNFSKDGKSYTGTWKNDVGGATGTNSGSRK